MRRARSTTTTAGESWVIVGQDGSRLRVSTLGKHATLAVAQDITLRAPEGTVLYVEQYHLIGAPTRLYRIERGEHDVNTEILSTAD